MHGTEMEIDGACARLFFMAGANWIEHVQGLIRG
jgi:hypothetical protein